LSLGWLIEVLSLFEIALLVVRLDHLPALSKTRITARCERPKNLAKSIALLIALDRRSRGLESSSALNQINNQDDDRNDEQEMNQTAANVAKKAKKPEHD